MMFPKYVCSFDRATPEMSFADFGRTYFNLDFSAFHISALAYIVCPQLTFDAHNSAFHNLVLAYTQYPIIRNGLIRNTSEI